MLCNLHTLSLRALPTSHLPVDRILTIISNNPQLHVLSLHFQGVLPAVLPLSPLTLPHLAFLSLGGHYHLTTLLDNLILPALVTLSLDIEVRDPIEDAITSLLLRSNHPPLEQLAIAFSTSLIHAGAAAAFYYGPGGMIITWTQLLAEIPELKTLKVGGTALEPLLSALGPPDEDTLTGLNLVQTHPAGTGGSSGPGQGWTWACPRLEVLCLRGCHAHSEGVTKLVQMVEARNPAVSLFSSNSNGANTASGGFPSTIGSLTPVRLKRLEMYDCTSLGEDVMKWLDARIAKVVCMDLISERWVHSLAVRFAG